MNVFEDEVLFYGLGSKVLFALRNSEEGFALCEGEQEQELQKQIKQEKLQQDQHKQQQQQQTKVKKSYQVSRV